jgi:hypothetical protein
MMLVHGVDNGLHFETGSMKRDLITKIPGHILKEESKKNRKGKGVAFKTLSGNQIFDKVNMLSRARNDVIVAPPL